jgi:hypothetical protein
MADMRGNLWWSLQRLLDSIDILAMAEKQATCDGGGTAEDVRFSLSRV